MDIQYSQQMNDMNDLSAKGKPKRPGRAVSFPIWYRKLKSQLITTQNGVVQINIQQPGNLYRFLGIAITPASATNATANTTANLQVSIVINSDQVMDSVSGTLLNPQTSGANQEYTPIFRKVSGNDQIQLNVKDTQSSTYLVCIYFDNPEPNS
jgi:hypothetical protein